MNTLNVLAVGLRTTMGNEVLGTSALRPVIQELNSYRSQAVSSAVSGLYAILGARVTLSQ